MRHPVLLAITFLVTCFSSSAQKINKHFEYHIRRTDSPIIIDGKIDEAGWQNAPVASSFYMVLPMDTSLADVPTEVRMTFDDKNLYLSAVCFNKLAGRYYVESLRRDFVFGKNDNFLLFLDPFNDQTNGFSFGANAAGAQWDGTMYGGGSVDLNWDNKWRSVVLNDSSKWVFEMAVPFTTIRYKKGIRTWGINFSRLDLKTTEKSSWAPMPRQFPTASMAYSGNLVWDEEPPSPGTNISVIPYALGGASKNYEQGTDTKFQNKFGADIKVGITSSLNLDLTINPDFSQVEVDRQVTNLDRFELFFPERRQFFLENGDLFANFGYSGIRPFFSRRIGLGVPINAGARLSGNLNKNWRLGVMDMQTAKVESTGLPQQNFAVVSLQRRVFSRSNIGFMLVNKQSLNYEPGKDTSKPTYSMYNRNVGFEYNLASKTNIWTGKALILKSFSPYKKGRDFTAAAHLQYSSRRWTALLQQEYVGSNYTAEAGYVPRKGYYKVNPQLLHLFFARKGVLLSHGPQLTSTYYFDEKLHETDHLNLLYYNFNFRNQSTLKVGGSNEYIKLLTPFDPTNSGKDTLAAGSQHRWNAFQAEYVSKPKSLFTFSFSTRAGSYYAKGKRYDFVGQLGYRFQPHATIYGNFSYNQIELPSPWDITRFWLIGCQFDLTLTNTIFFSTFFQYNEQLKNMNLNSRFQWRYAPASDLFIVYTDNYL
ncbi:MAG TPA: DUF5916 domain-containing protein, partial [Flavitalea sp.]|nr:DUF5916 domain-containing protein [Flavitalea sp.]